VKHLEGALGAWHRAVASNPWAQRFTAFTRILLALGYLPSGLTKVLGHPFTALGPETSVGAFFGGFFQAGAYYAFVGWMQLTAALLLVLPWTGMLGAVIYFPIALNIFVITVAVGFEGTPVITGLMLLASFYLLCWDYPTLKALLPRRTGRAAGFTPKEYLWQALTWSVAGMLAYGVLLAANVANLQRDLGLIGFPVAALAGLLFGVVLAWHLRHFTAHEPC